MTIAKVFIYRIKHDQNLDFIDLRTLKKQAVTKNGVNNATLAAYFNAPVGTKKIYRFWNAPRNIHKALKSMKISLEKFSMCSLKHKIDLCFCPGGLYGSSFLWRKM